MPENSDQMVFWTVVAGRFLIPLLIPRFPLPGILLSFFLDAVDQTIFQQFTKISLDGYQGYDKALDTYYLTIAYLSMMRNWVNIQAFKIGSFLYYLRVVGDVFFQLTNARVFLLIFPNIFEYFFDFYEFVRLRWKPIRLSPKLLILAALFIWIFIKLPQEYWIHIAQLDTTDLIKTNIFGVTTDTTFIQIFREFPLTLVVLFVFIALVAVISRFVMEKLPKPDHHLQIVAVPEIKPLPFMGIKKYKDLINRELLEKVVLLTMVSVVFAQVLPGLLASNIQIVLGVTAVVVVNTFITYFLKRNRSKNLSMPVNFAAMTLINLGIAFIYIVILPFRQGGVDTQGILFFSLMIALLVTLYDYYNPYHLARIKKLTGK